MPLDHDVDMPLSTQDSNQPRTARRWSTRWPARGLAPQLAWFTAIGVVMTLSYLVLYIALRGTLGAQPANVVSWVATAIVDTAANRQVTFGVRGRAGATRAQFEGLLVFGIGMALTSGSLFTLSAMTSHPTQLLELGVLTLSNLLAGLLRFWLLRHWVFHPRRHAWSLTAARPAR